MNKQSYQEEFDMNTSFISTQQIKDLINEQKFTSTQEIMNCMKNMFADILEQTLQAEMDQHLGYEHAERRNDDAKKNYRNGSVKRTMKTQLGEVEVNVPRDRNGEFEPKIISKYQRNADGIEERILSLYAAGMSTRDIKEQIKGLYDVEISEGLVSKISERILPEVKQWQDRPLEACYPFVFMDAIHYKIRKIIYTTNAIEGLNRQFRKVTKTKNVFPNDDSLRKMLYLAIQNLSSRWTQRCRNWDLIINQLRIMDSNEE